MSDPTTVEELKERWAKECAEWQAIRDELMYPGLTAFDVTAEQRRRMKARGEISVLDGMFARRFIHRAVDPECECHHTMSRHQPDGTCRDCGCAFFETRRPS
jgi:hypothetical protein